MQTTLIAKDAADAVYQIGKYCRFIAAKYGQAGVRAPTKRDAAIAYAAEKAIETIAEFCETVKVEVTHQQAD